MKLSKPSLLLPFLLLSGCSEPEPGPPAEELLLMRERAAAWFGEDRFEAARRELAPLVGGDAALAAGAPPSSLPWHPSLPKPRIIA